MSVMAQQPASVSGDGPAAFATAAAGSTPVPPTPSPSMPVAPMASLQTPCKEEHGGSIADDCATAKVLSLTPLAGGDAAAAATAAGAGVPQVGSAAGEAGPAVCSGGVILNAVTMQAEQRDGKVEACRSLEVVGSGEGDGRACVVVSGMLGRAGSDVVMADAGGEAKTHGLTAEGVQWRENKENEANNVQLTPGSAEGGLHGRPSPKVNVAHVLCTASFLILSFQPSSWDCFMFLCHHAMNRVPSLCPLPLFCCQCVLQQGSCRSDSSGTTSPVGESPPVPVAPLEERAEQLRD